jgi:hypothetical protein
MVTAAHRTFLTSGVGGPALTGVPEVVLTGAGADLGTVDVGLDSSAVVASAVAGAGAA